MLAFLPSCELIWFCIYHCIMHLSVISINCLGHQVDCLQASMEVLDVKNVDL